MVEPDAHSALPVQPPAVSLAEALRPPSTVAYNRGPQHGTAQRYRMFPDWWDRALKAWKETHNKSAAADASGVSVRTIDRRLKSSTRSFDEWHAAGERVVDLVESKVLQTALGPNPNALQAGIFLLKAWRPGVYKDVVKTEHAISEEAQAAALQAAQGRSVRFTFELAVGAEDRAPVVEPPA